MEVAMLEQYFLRPTTVDEKKQSERETFFFERFCRFLAH
jgi:hypothetical protein